MVIVEQALWLIYDAGKEEKKCYSYIHTPFAHITMTHEMHTSHALLRGGLMHLSAPRQQVIT